MYNGWFDDQEEPKTPMEAEFRRKVKRFDEIVITCVFSAVFSLITALFVCWAWIKCFGA